MLRARLGFFLVFLAVAAVIATPLAAKDRLTEPVTGSFKLDGPGRLSLENINGYVHVSTWDRNEVKVDGVKSASSQERLDNLVVRMDDDGNFVQIKAEFEKHPRWHDDGEARVDFEITVPSDIRIDEISLVNGNLTIDDVEGQVHASTVNGGLTAKGLSGDVELSTVNGTLEVTFTRLEPTASIKLQTVNGTVDVTIPRKTGVRLSASTVNGSIRNDLGLPVSKMEVVGRSMRGTIGDGGASIDVGAVNGAIRIRGEDGER